MDKKISIMIYLNIFVILIVAMIYYMLEPVPVMYIFIILIIYAIINSIYINRKLLNQKNLEEGLISEKALSNMILESIPTGIVIIEPTGIIKYVNQAIGQILGSVETVGMNILKFDTIIDTGIDKNIQDAIEGKESETSHLNYTSYTSRKNMILKLNFKPFKYIQDEEKYEVMMLINNITEEINLKNKIEDQYFGIFKSFAKFIDAKDKYTGEHSYNVSKYVELFIEDFDITEKEKHDIRIAAALHDIGKIGIEEAILNKPDKLSHEEFEQMKMHTVISSELLGEIDDYRAISKIVRYHHERWNGSGYPDGLKGDEIPLGSQIIAIADTYDAITSNRIYHKARTKMEAIDILKKERFKHFNGDLVDLFIDKISDS